MIATGFTIDDIRGFPDCMLLIEGARSCDQTTDVQRRRLEAIDRQIADLERRRMRLIKTLSEPDPVRFAIHYGADVAVHGLSARPFTRLGEQPARHSPTTAPNRGTHKARQSSRRAR
nr:MerR family DNA-binding protein [Burkholderia pyrrocinia]